MQTSLIIDQSSNLIDATYYERLQAAAGEVEAIYLFLGPASASLEAERKAFIASGHTASPDLRPNPDSMNRFAAPRRALEALLADVATNDQPIRGAYTARISELLTNLDMLAAVANHDAAAFDAANQAIYSSPRLDVFAAVVEHYRAWASAITEPGLQPFVVMVLEALPIISTPATWLEPSPALFKQVQVAHRRPNGYFDLLFADIALPETGYINESTGDDIVRQILWNVQATDYQLSDSPDDTWGVVHGSKQLIRPSRYSLTREAFEGVLAHEIGSHLVERINGSRQPLRLLASGLDRYEAGNEGRALLREQIVYNDPASFYASARWNDILRRHLTICLGLGLDQSSPRSFSEVYAILNSLDQLWALTHGATEADADASTWQLLTRVLKGTDGTAGAYLKDIVYLEGNISCWQAAAQDPNLIMLGDQGKFNIARASHLALLQSLKIIPATS